MPLPTLWTKESLSRIHPGHRRDRSEAPFVLISKFLHGQQRTQHIEHCALRTHLISSIPKRLSYTSLASVVCYSSLLSSYVGFGLPLLRCKRFLRIDPPLRLQTGPLLAHSCASCGRALRQRRAIRFLVFPPYVCCFARSRCDHADRLIYISLSFCLSFSFSLLLFLSLSFRLVSFIISLRTVHLTLNHLPCIHTQHATTNICYYMILSPDPSLSLGLILMKLAYLSLYKP
jgi:hypothetical protein